MTRRPPSDTQRRSCTVSGSLNARLILPVITKTAGRAFADAVSNAAGGCCQRIAFRPVSLSSEKYACVPVAPVLNVERFGAISLSGVFSFCVYEAAFSPASTATSKIRKPKMKIFCFIYLPCTNEIALRQRSRKSTQSSAPARRRPYQLRSKFDVRPDMSENRSSRFRTSRR